MQAYELTVVGLTATPSASGSGRILPAQVSLALPWDRSWKEEARMLNFNEGKACDSVVRRLEEREASSRSDVRWPEQEQHKAPIEVAFKLGDQLFALEHTGIEPFGGHVEMENRAKHLYTPITDALKDVLGTTALFELYIPINAFQNKKKLDIRTIQNALITWVKRTASTMPQRPDGNGTRVGPTDVSEVPFKVTLVRFEPPPIPVYFQIRHEAKDIEKLRAKRIQKAIDDKFPKLAQWKADENAKTVLVLEANDVQLTAPDLVADTFVSLVKDRADRPDETYLVGTFMTPCWYVWPILIGDKTYDDFVRDDGPEHWAFDPAKLSTLTKAAADPASTSPDLSQAQDGPR
jgi:hypothetical protein